MKILVDTSIWSLAFRKQLKSQADEQVIQELSELIRELRVALIGPIRQEILSGISDKEKFKQLQKKLRQFDDEKLRTEHYEMAASLSNECRRHGIQGSHIDFLLCAVSLTNNCSIYTLDKDFEQFQKHIKIKLHARRAGLS
ncbi:MAG: PIN domain-containing protein [Pseudomonadota bacterium]